VLITWWCKTLRNVLLESWSGLLPAKRGDITIQQEIVISTNLPYSIYRYKWMEMATTELHNSDPNDGNIISWFEHACWVLTTPHLYILQQKQVLIDYIWNHSTDRATHWGEKAAFSDYNSSTNNAAASTTQAHVLLYRHTTERSICICSVETRTYSQG